MPAMTPLSWSPAVATCPSTPCDFLTRSQRVQCGEFPDTRNAPPHLCLLKGVRQQTSWRPLSRVPALGPRISATAAHGLSS